MLGTKEATYDAVCREILCGSRGKMLLMLDQPIRVGFSPTGKLIYVYDTSQGVEKLAATFNDSQWCLFERHIEITDATGLKRWAEHKKRLIIETTVANETGKYTHRLCQQKSVLLRDNHETKELEMYCLLCQLWIETGYISQAIIEPVTLEDRRKLGTK